MTWKRELKKEILDKGLDMGEFTLQELFIVSLKSLEIKLILQIMMELFYLELMEYL